MATNIKNQDLDAENDIDLLRLAKLLWHRLWLILLVALLCGALGYGYSYHMLKPTYSASVMLYVNSGGSISIGDGSFKASTAGISTSRTLVSTYIVILKNRTTMEQVVEKTGLPYSSGALLGMVSANAVNDTEVFSVTVTCGNPEEAALLANAIAEVLPLRVSEVIEGTSVRVVDDARVNYNKIAPSNSRYAAIGFVIGLVLTCGLIVLRDLLDSTLREDDYLFESLDIPILTKVPDLCVKDSGKYYYSHYGRRGHYGQYGKYGRYGR